MPEELPHRQPDRLTVRSPARGTTTDAPTVRLSSPAQIVAAIPYLVGFHPAESVVAVGLRADSATVCVTMRVDLPMRRASRPLADMIAAHLAHAGAGATCLAVFTEQTHGHAPRAGLIRALEAALEPHEISVVDAIWVRSGRWRSYRCRRPDCCPPGGTAVDASAVPELAAAAAWMGEAVLDSREDLERSLAPLGADLRAELDRTFEWVGRRLIEELAQRGWDAVASDSRKLLSSAVSARVEASAELAPADVARLALGLADVAVRDAALAWVGTDLEHAAESLWVELVRRATPPYDSAPATLLAVHAYLRGNGAYARIALDRALASDPGYSFARLLAEGLDRGVPPGALRDALALCADAA